MSVGPRRLTVVLTHPVQYYSPWFRYITAERHREIDLTVLYGVIPTAEQQGVGFDTAFTWDPPLTDGHRFVVCAASAGQYVGSDRFFGLDVPDIAERIRATAPEVVIVPGWHSAMEVRAVRACRQQGVPVLYRGDSTLRSGPRRLLRPIWAVKTRVMLRRFDRYLSVGRDAHDYLRAFAIPESHIHASPHAVDNEWFAAQAAAHRATRRGLRDGIGARDDDFVVLFAGKFVPRKRPLDAVRAAAAMGAGVVLLTAGDGELAGAARAEAARLGVRLHWRGFLNQSELPEAFAAADALLVPSTWESWGLIVNEALASGVPCVVTDRVAAGRDLVVDGRTGFSVPVGDVAAMADRLGALRAMRDRGLDVASLCQRHVDSHSFAASTQGVVEAIRAIDEARRVAQVTRG